MTYAQTGNCQGMGTKRWGGGGKWVCGVLWHGPVIHSRVAVVCFVASCYRDWALVPCGPLSFTAYSTLSNLYL